MPKYRTETKRKNIKKKPAEPRADQLTGLPIEDLERVRGLLDRIIKKARAAA